MIRMWSPNWKHNDKTYGREKAQNISECYYDAFIWAIFHGISCVSYGYCWNGEDSNVSTCASGKGECVSISLFPNLKSKKAIDQ